MERLVFLGVSAPEDVTSDLESEAPGAGEGVWMRDCRLALGLRGSEVGCWGCGATGVIGVSGAGVAVGVIVSLAGALALTPLGLAEALRPFSSSARSSSDIMVVATEVISFMREISPIW